MDCIDESAALGIQIWEAKLEQLQLWYGKRLRGSGLQRYCKNS